MYAQTEVLDLLFCQRSMDIVQQLAGLALRPRSATAGRVRPSTPEYARVRPSTPECARVRHTRSYPVIPGHTRSCPSHTRSYPVIPGHTRSYPVIPGHTRSYPVIPGHTVPWFSAVAVSRHSANFFQKPSKSGTVTPHVTFTRLPSKSTGSERPVDTTLPLYWRSLGCQRS